MAKKVYKHPKRTPEQLKRLAKRVVKYYFENPHANNLKYIRDKFKIHEAFVRKSIEAALDERFKNAQRVRNS